MQSKQKDVIGSTINNSSSLFKSVNPPKFDLAVEESIIIEQKKEKQEIITHFLQTPDRLRSKKQNEVISEIENAFNDIEPNVELLCKETGKSIYCITKILESIKQIEVKELDHKSRKELLFIKISVNQIRITIDNKTNALKTSEELIALEKILSELQAVVSQLYKNAKPSRYL